MPFEFATARRVLFGPGALSQAGTLAAELGRSALVVTGGAPERAEPLLDLLAGAGVEDHVFPVRGEPTVEAVEEATLTARASGCGIVIGFGGGSAVDAGKAVSALATNDRPVLDYLEVVGKGLPLARPPLPFVAIPTTAGAGAEVTRNAVIASRAHGVKVSLRSALMLPRLAVVDPELTLGLPPEVTAATGMDALAQLVEAFVSLKANPVTDALCREGMARAARSLRRAFDHGEDLAAREDMALAALLSGMALANAGLGAVHGFAAVLGGMAEAPHGALCARLLPEVMASNLSALREREPASPALGRYTEVARILTGEPGARDEDGVAWVRALAGALSIKPLSAFGARRDDFAAIAEKAEKASSMKGNPVALTPAELTGILERAL